MWGERIGTVAMCSAWAMDSLPPPFQGGSPRSGVGVCSQLAANPPTSLRSATSLKREGLGSSAFFKHTQFFRQRTRRGRDNLPVLHADALSQHPGTPHVVLGDQPLCGIWLL